MSGGGKIIEREAMTIPGNGQSVVRYRVMTEYRSNWFDETFVYALPQEDEPGLGEAIWWGGGTTIYWGPNDSKRLAKVGYSWGADE
jgi:hypothetical protein